MLETSSIRGGKRCLKSGLARIAVSMTVQKSKGLSFECAMNEDTGGKIGQMGW
jgi:hypothetical protein